MFKTKKEATAYASHIGHLTDQLWLVFELPKDSQAYAMDYRYGTCTQDKAGQYLADGAVFVV